MKIDHNCFGSRESEVQILSPRPIKSITYGTLISAEIGIEIKAGSAVEKKDFNHIRWFQKNLTKSRIFIGIILYTGEFPASFGNNLWAVPFGLLWS